MNLRADAMTGTLLARLPQLMPALLDWAAKTELQGIRTGKPLAFWQQADARDVGVRHIAKVRLCLVETMPLISNATLRDAARAADLLGPDTIGLTLGHAVFILRSHAGKRRLLRHELRHVAQQEETGDMQRWLRTYLEQVIRLGYAQAPLEIDARQFETRVRPGLP